MRFVQFNKFSVVCRALLSAVSLTAPVGASAETISSALAKAYLINPRLNAQRADNRAVDENLPAAYGQFRPTVASTADAGILRQYVAGSQPRYQSRLITHPIGVNLAVSQNLFNGFKSVNSVYLAKSQILSARGALRSEEADVLYNAAVAYVSVLRDGAIVNLRRSNVDVLLQQLSNTQDRLEGGEVTRTDLSQARAALSQGRADAASAEIILQNSIASYRLWINDTPKGLGPASVLDSLVPRTEKEAIRIAVAEHPLVQASRSNVESAAFSVKIAESQLYPTLGVVGALTQRANDGGAEHQRIYSAEVSAQLSVPIYEGGIAYAAVRQAKEQLSEARLLSDQQILQVQAQVQSCWGSWSNARTVATASRAQTKASEDALAGVREEAKFGQRTTLDILNAQQYLVNARVSYIAAQANLITSSYCVLSSVGRLSAATLGLRVPHYDPGIHLDDVKYKAIGLEPGK